MVRIDHNKGVEIFPDEAKRLISEEEGKAVMGEAISHCSSEGSVQVSLMSYWRGELGWARNRASLTSDRRNIALTIHRRIRGGYVQVTTNQIDAQSIAGAVRSAEEYAISQANQRPDDRMLEKLEWGSVGGPVWSDSTFNRAAEDNGATVIGLTERAEREGLLSAGYLESHAATITAHTRDKFGRIEETFRRFTQAQCSVTVRHPQGTGSGWAGHSSYDFDRIDESRIATSALDKCIASLNAVRVEPGRYTTILEPQATFELVDSLVAAMSRIAPERGGGPFVLDADRAVGRWISKLGLQIVDKRVTISHDPADPEIATVESGGVEAVTLVRDGVLTSLFNSKQHALNELGESTMSAHRKAFRMSGGTTSVEDMIESTQRGLLVTRFSAMTPLDGPTLLSTAVTRDGLWLIENGKITRAVRNFRITESPLFVLNNIDQIGPAVPIWNPVVRPETLIHSAENALASAIVPTLKVNDFSFTSTVDAV